MHWTCMHSTGVCWASICACIGEVYVGLLYVLDIYELYRCVLSCLTLSFNVIL